MKTSVLILGGISALLLSRRTGMVGLGFHGAPSGKQGPVSLQSRIQEANADPWLTYVAGGKSRWGGKPSVFSFTPPFNNALWTIDKRALGPLLTGSSAFKVARNRLRDTNRAIQGARKNPIILKATDIDGLKKAVVSLTANGDKALAYSQLRGPTDYKADWLVSGQATWYRSIIRSALDKANLAIQKAQKAQDTKDSLAELDAATKIPDAPAGERVSGGLRAPVEDTPVKNSWQDLLKEYAQQNAQPSVRVAPRPAPQQQRQPTIASRRPLPVVPAAPKAGIDPLAAGAAAAIPLILAAVL